MRSALDDSRLPLLFLFLRLPIAGRVKTRLAAETSPELACNLYRILAEIVYEKLLPGVGADYQLVLYATPADQLPAIQDWLAPAGIPPGVLLMPQPDGTLAGRLEHAARFAAQSGAPAVLFLGSDCVDLTREEIGAALAALHLSDAAIGLAEDGGFWLLALRQWEAGLFEGISYSQPTTGDQLCERLMQRGHPPAMLTQKTDIDTLADLHGQPPAVRKKILGKAMAARVDIPSITTETMGKP